MSTAELACTYAALILHDDGVEITVSLSCRLPPITLCPHDTTEHVSHLLGHASSPHLSALPDLNPSGAHSFLSSHVSLSTRQIVLTRTQADKIEAILKAANVKVDAYWPGTYA